MKKHNKFELFGYAFADDKLLNLKEVTFQAEAEELRSFAAFFIHVAELVEQHGSNFGHKHYYDWIESREEYSESCDVIIVGPKKGKRPTVTAQSIVRSARASQKSR